MSRSIHDTRGVALTEWLKAMRDQTPQAWARAERVRANVHRQRSIRKRVRQTRERGEPAPMDALSVPILVAADHPGIHHGASERDLRAVMSRLPPGSLDGLGSIVLRAEDPHRSRHELAGVIAPERRGNYCELDRRIRLHAFEEASDITPRLACFLRIVALGTFVHELAHHFDFMFRTTGDRWRMDDAEKTEAFARARAEVHLETIVIPYLEAAYPEDHATVQYWSSRLRLFL